MASSQTTRSNIHAVVEIFECALCGSDSGGPCCRHPGDSLEGQVIVLADSVIQLSGIEVSFQGQFCSIMQAYCLLNV